VRATALPCWPALATFSDSELNASLPPSLGTMGRLAAYLKLCLLAEAATSVSLLARRPAIPSSSSTISVSPLAHHLPPPTLHPRLFPHCLGAAIGTLPCELTLAMAQVHTPITGLLGCLWGFPTYVI